MARKKSETGAKPPVKALAKAKDIKEKLAKEKVTGFIEFIREQGVMGLAIGLVLGTAVKSVVDSMVNNIIQPLLGLMTGGVKFDDKYACLKHVVDQGCVNKLTWGSFVGSIISFITIAAVVYFVFKGLKLDKLDKKKDSKP